MVFHSEFKKVPITLSPLNSSEVHDIKSELIAKLETDLKIESNEELIHFLVSSFSLSPYLKSSAFKESVFLSELFEGGFQNTSNAILKSTNDLGLSGLNEDEFMAQIRTLKRRIALLCGIADLGGWWSCKTVTKTLSNFASASLNACLDFILLQEHRSDKLSLSDPSKPQKNSGLIVLGMGKLGASELNYSSDIDLILFFDAAASLNLKTDDAITYWNRLAKKLIKYMQERTSDGYVFRMDLRLRPDPSATPLVIPIEAALSYYEGQGQNWERAAMIKAKAVAGDMESGESFLRELSPFMWRKYLDFAAIDDIRSIKRQIHAHKGHHKISVLGHNIKLGRGGIREIEFFAQTQQLIAGGRNPELRVNETEVALLCLSEKRWIKRETYAELKHAYWFLRNLEHRIQMVSDHQTHTLPDTYDELIRIARMFGEDDVKLFEERVELILKTVEKHYAALFENAQELGVESGNLVFTGDADDPDTVSSLEKLGYKNPSGVIKTIRSWHSARLPALRNDKARELLTELMPVLLDSFSNTSNPDVALFKFDQFVSRLPAGIQLFSILKSNPSIGSLLVHILDAAPRLANMIARKPYVFDAFLDPQFDIALNDKKNLRKILSELLMRVTDYEVALDDARRFFQQCQFLIGCHIFTGKLTPSAAKNCFTILGEVMVEEMLIKTQEAFSQRHGYLENSEICILAMGRLGSMELSATSDLDLIFLYRDGEGEYSNGLKSLHSSQYFIRLIQRFISAMSSPTAEGIIFELDFRLRPSGNAGPIATHIEHFLKYQSDEAWVWEAQALTRARPVAGDASLCDEIIKVRPKLIQKAVIGKNIKKEIRQMRTRMESEKNMQDIWDVKYIPGGLIDIEFIAQYLALEFGATDTMDTKNLLSQYKKHLGIKRLNELKTAYDLFAEINILQSICIGKNFEMADAPQGFIELLCSQLDLPDLPSLEAYLKHTQQRVRKIFWSILA